MTARSGKSVTIRNLTKAYADVVALDDVGLEIAPGEFCTLLGASGSGKTTLLKVIAGFEPHDQGQVEIGGRDVSGMPVASRNIGMVFQSYALFPHMSVHRNVAFGLEMRRLPADEISRRVAEALDLVRLTDLGGRLPSELSGGQQQRVALARALVIEPDILLMDEPLGALDKNLRQSIQEELKELHRQVGATIVYVTHDQEEALHLSDRIVILDQGRVVQAGTARELYFAPSNPFVAGFLGECNFLKLDDGSEAGLRPEALSIATASGGAPNRMTLEVDTSVFVGAGVKLIGRSRGRRVVALLSHDELPEPPQPGQRVELTFRDRSLMRF